MGLYLYLWTRCLEAAPTRGATVSLFDYKVGGMDAYRGVAVR